MTSMKIIENKKGSFSFEKERIRGAHYEINKKKQYKSSTCFKPMNNNRIVDKGIY